MRRLTPRQLPLSVLLVPFALAALLMMAAFLAMPAGAQLTGAANSAKVVTVRPALSVSAMRPGQTVQAAVVFTVADGWHVNSNRPTQDYLRPTLVKLTLPKGLTAGSPKYPPSKQITFSFSPDPVDVFSGRNVVTFPVTLAKGVKPGTIVLKGTLSFQPCNDTACFPPSEKPFSLSVRVATGVAVSPANPDVFGGTAASAGGNAAGAGATGNRYADVLNRYGLLAFLALVFLGGILLNLTPCVYPMIAVTMAIFGARAGDPRGRVMGRAAVYVLGMATMYTVLGVFAGLTGNLFGGILQSVWVKVGIAAFLFVLALGMFGVYTMQAPPKVAAALGGANRTGTIGLYLSGLVVGIFAAPCVGPVVLFLLTMVGERQDPVFGAVSFFTLALGLGTPYILLAASTGLLTRMPRSGAWMEWVKHVFGVILVGVAAWYLALALAPRYVALVIPATLALGAIYLGFFDPHGRELKKFQVAKVVTGALVALLGLYLGAGAVMGLRATATRQAERWPLYSDAALQQALKDGRPVVMDFSASWCAQCRELEHNTFSDPQVQRALEPFARFRVELDGAHLAQAPDLQKKWNVSGLPAIVFLDPGGREVASARVGGFIPPRQFLKQVALVPSQVAAR